MTKKKKRHVRKPPEPGAPRRAARPLVVQVDELERVERAAEAIAQAQREFVEAIDAARGHGRTWAELGQVVGLTHQGVQQKHARWRAAMDAPAGSSSPEASALGSHRP